MPTLDRMLRYVLVPALTAAVLAAAAPRSGSSEPAALAVEPLHADGARMEQGVLDATRAFLREDPKAARRALDVLEENCRSLFPEEDEVFGPDVVSYDRAFHLTLNRARELAGRGEMEDAFNQFVWVQRACVTCHGLAREAGLPVPEPPPPR